MAESISRNRAYRLEVFEKTADLGKSGQRSARRNGLPVHYCHNRGYVLGEDWLNYLAAQSTTPPGPAEGTDPRQKTLDFPED